MKKNNEWFKTTVKNSSIPEGRFDSDLIGTIKTVNVNDWGIRGIMFTQENKEMIYIINYDRIVKEQIPILSKGDVINLTRVWITEYKGKVTKWNGKEQAKLCKKATIQHLRKGEAETNHEVLSNNSQKITSSVQAFENLQTKVKEAKESLQPLEQMVSLQDCKAIDTKEFIRVSIQASLQYQRLLAAILTVLEREE
ncbi:MAG: hypothetical protein HZR80_05060 [Candidatus Heimdallarchaeota archaeon]